LAFESEQPDDQLAPEPIVLGVHIMLNEKLARLERLVMIPPTLLRE